jgi:hypothetical protein
MLEYQKKVSPTSLFLPLVRCVSPSLAFGHRPQSGIPPVVPSYDDNEATGRFLVNTSVEDSQKDHLYSALKLPLKRSMASVAKGLNFGRKTPKGPLKFLGAGKTAGRIFTRFAIKGPNFFKTLVSWIFWESFEMNAFVSLLYPHIL